jgi:heparanase
MGSTVLDAGVPIREGLHVYAHCLSGTPGGVALLAINNSRTQTASIALPVEAERYTLSAEQPESLAIQLNGQDLKLGRKDELPDLVGKRIPIGPAELAPASISFLTMAGAGNGNCR